MMKRYCLKDVAEIYSGATPLTKKKNFYENGTISWITPKDLSGYKHKYIYSGQRSITEEGYRSCATSLLPEGTVLFSSRAPIGYVAIAGKELCTNQGFKSFVCNDEVLFNHYLYYYLIKNRDKLEALGNGSTFKEISRKTLLDYQIDLPAVEEQKKIVQDLVDLDNRYENNCGIIKSIDELMEYLYCKFFEDEDITYDDMDLGSVVEIVTGGTPSTNNKNYWSNGIYYWYTPSDVTSSDSIISYESQNKISVSGLANSSAKLIPPMSILMTSRATIGEATINKYESTTNQGMLALIPKDERLSILQLYYWIKRNKKKIASIANGSTFKEVYKKDMSKLQLRINENATVEYMKKTKRLFELYESLTSENKLIGELKNCILDTVFN